MNRKIIIPALAALALAGAAQAQERPYQYSAQCLVEIASMTSEQMDFADPEMVEAATAKANRLMDSQQRTINAGAALDVASVNMIALMRVEEAAGRLPPGSADVTAEQHRIHRLLVDNEHLDFRRTAPSCDWPTEPNDDPSARE